MTTASFCDINKRNSRFQPICRPPSMLFAARSFSSKNDKDDDYSKKFESMMGSQMSDADKAAIEKEKIAKEAKDAA